MDKIKQNGANALETRDLENETIQREDELRSLTDLELTLAGGGDDVIHW